MWVVGDVVSKNCFYDSSQNLLANEIFIVCSSITLFFDLYQIFDPHCHRSSSSPLPIHMYVWLGSETETQWGPPPPGPPSY